MSPRKINFFEVTHNIERENCFLTEAGAIYSILSTKVSMHTTEA